MKISPQSGWRARAGAGLLRSSASGLGSSGLIRNQTSLPHSLSLPGQRAISTIPAFFSVNQLPSTDAGGGAPAPLAAPTASSASPPAAAQAIRRGFIGMGHA